MRSRLRDHADEIAALRAQGMSDAAISRHFGFSRERVRMVMGKRDKPHLIEHPEHRKLLCELWVSTMDSTTILSRIRALPGLQQITYDQMRKLAGRMGVTRPIDKSRTEAQKQATEKATEARKRAQAPVVARTRGASFDTSWPPSQIALLEELWRAGLSTRDIGDRLGCTKNAAVGKAHRLIDRGILEPRPSPIIRDGKPRPPRPRAILPIPAVTLPKLPSEVAPPPVAIVEHTVVRIDAPPKNGPLMSAIARGTTGHISPFDNVTFRPVRKEPPAQPYISPLAKCAFPLWKNGERPTHIYCDALVDRRSYCKHHADLCLTRFYSMRTQDIAA